MRVKLKNYRNGKLDRVKVTKDGNVHGYSRYIPNTNAARYIMQYYVKQCGFSQYKAILRTIDECLGIPRKCN